MSIQTARRKKPVSTGILSLPDVEGGRRSMSPVGGGPADDVSIELRDVTTTKKTQPKAASAAKTDGKSKGNSGNKTSSFGEATKGASPRNPDSNADQALLHITVSADPKDKKNNGSAVSRETNRSDDLNDEIADIMDSPSKSVSLPKTPTSRPSSDLEVRALVHSSCSSRSGTKSGTPGSASRTGSAGGGDSDYYCVDHMTLCSSKEAQEVHNKCEFLVPAFEWAEAQTMERDRKNVEAQLKRFDVFAGTMLQERSNMKRQLCESKEDVQDDFLDLVEDLIALLLARQKEFMARLDEVHAKHMKTVNDQIRRCKKVQQETNESLQELEACPSSGEEYSKLKKRLNDKCPVYEEILRRDFNAAVRMDYEFRPDPWVDQIFQNLTSLGDVVARPKEQKLPGFLSMSKEIDFSKMALHVVGSNDATSGSDTNSCCLTGCTFLPDGRMVLADWNNACLKMFNKRGVLIARLALPNNPWDVEIIDGCRVVATVPGEPAVYIIGYTGQELTVLSSFQTDCECWAVTVIGEKLAMTCDPWSKEPSVRMYTLAGKYIAFYQKDGNGKQLFSYPEHITTDHNQTTLYVSDSRSDTVLAITVEGCLLFRYTHKELSYPAGVCTDNQGYLYICGKESRNIHQVTKTGEFVRLLFNNMEMEAPRAICFEFDGNNMIVTDVGKSNCDDFMTAKLE